MAWLRAMGGNVSAEFKIYDNGTWNAPYDNPGSWTGPSNISPATFGADSFTLTCTSTTSALIGTSNMIDLTNYTMVKIKVHVTGGVFAFAVTNSKNWADVAVNVNINPNTGYAEYVLNVSNLTAGYIGFWGGSGTNRTATVTEITLA